MRSPNDSSFLGLGEVEFADRVSRAGIAPAYWAGVIENLRTLQGHAKRVADALADDPDAPTSRLSHCGLEAGAMRGTHG